MRRGTCVVGAGGGLRLLGRGAVGRLAVGVGLAEGQGVAVTIAVAGGWQWRGHWWGTFPHIYI